MAWRTPMQSLLEMSVARVAATVAGDCTRDLEHFGHPADDFHDAREVLAIAYAQFEHQRRTVGVLLFDRHALDVGIARGNRGGHGSETAHLVADVDTNLRAEHFVRGRLPRDRQPVLGMLAVVLD